MYREEIAPRYPALEGGVGVGEPMNELKYVTRGNRAEIPPKDLTVNHILGGPIAAVRSKFDVSGDEYFKKQFWC